MENKIFNTGKNIRLIFFFTVVIVVAAIIFWQIQIKSSKTDNDTNKLNIGNTGNSCVNNDDCSQYCVDNECIIGSCTKSSGTANTGQCTCLNICGTNTDPG